jgi:hypothetical protein
VSPVKYELDFYIPEDGILHSHRRENLKSWAVRLSAVGADRPPLGPQEDFRYLFLLETDSIPGAQYGCKY